MFEKISFPIIFIIAYLTGKFLSAIYVNISTAVNFCTAHTNLGKVKDLKNIITWYFKTISFIFIPNVLKLNVWG